MALLAELALLLIVISAGRLDASENNVYCDPTYRVELEKSLTLQCKISRDHDFTYWFRGSDTSGVPLIWQDHEVGGEGIGEYNMTVDGALVINSASLHHEGVYTIVVYISGAQYKATTEVQVTIAPNPRCPTFNTLCNATCSSSCAVKASGNGRIQCSVNGSRPKTAIIWNITGQSGIRFREYVAEFAHNPDSDTWNSTLELDYVLDANAGGATIQCVALEEDEWDSSERTVKLHYDIGQDTPTASPTPQEVDTGFTIITSVIVVSIVVVTAIILVICCIARKGRDARAGEEMVPLNEQPQSSQITEDQQLERLLMSHLRGLYEKECLIEPLPWDQPLPISSFYTPCGCKIGQRQANTDELLSPSFQFDHNRVLIIADVGYGKTAFAKHVVDQWRAGSERKTILINVLSKEVNGDTRLSEYILRMLPPETILTAERIENIIQTNVCLILLDGLEELSMSMSARPKKTPVLAKPNGSSESKDYKFGLTVGDLLTGNIPLSYKKVNIWVTSRGVDHTNSCFLLPYTKVTLSGFSDTQLNRYITNVCKHYSESRKSRPSDPALGPGMTEAGEEHVNADELAKRVKDTLEYNDISKEFATTPLLLIMIINIIASKFVDPEGRMKTVALDKLITIVRMVINCLESRYTQGTQARENVHEQLKSLEEKLGKLAVVMRCKLEEEFVNMDEISKEDIDIALAVGILRLAREVTGNSSNLVVPSLSSIKFYHQYFQEYFAAKYARFNDGGTALQKIVGASSDTQTIRLLQFMAGSDHPQLRGVLTRLITPHKMWNNFIDCIYEIEGNIKQEETMKHFKKQIERSNGWNLGYLDNKYHREAVSTNLALCKRTNIKIPILAFTEDAAVDLLEHLILPVIHDLRFSKLNVEEDNFVKIIEFISRKDNIPTRIEFQSCMVPVDVSHSARERIQSARERKRLNITRKNQDGYASETFNLTSCKWRRITGRVFDGVNMPLVASPEVNNHY